MIKGNYTYCYFKFIKIASAATFLLAAAGSGAQAKSVEYHVIESPIGRVVEELSSVLGTSITLLGASDVKVSHWDAYGSAEAVVNKLANDYAMLFHFDGSKYELTPRSSVTSEMIDLHGIPYPQARSIIHGMYKSYSSESVQPLPGSRFVLVKGSRDFVSSIEKLLKCANTQSVEVYAFGRKLGLDNEDPKKNRENCS